MWTEPLSDDSRLVGVLKSYGVAIVTTGLAVMARHWLDPHLDNECPFSLFYLSVLLTAWIAGTGPAYLAIALGTGAAACFFVKPQSNMVIDSVSEIVQLLIYVVVNCVATVLFDRLRRQRLLAEQRSRDNEQLSNSLRQADERKDEFLALLAHELRNPLAPIRAGLEVLEREPKIAPSTERVRKVIERQTNHLVRLTNDLLDVSRFTRGKLELKVGQIDLRDAVDDAIEMTASAVADKGHRFQRLVPEEPVWVMGDRARLAQLTANLLDNATKYTPPSGCIVLELYQTPGWVVLSVRDNGIGFPPEQADSILQPFCQMNMSITRDYGGLGLGLSIVKTLAELHHGKLSASSAGPGLGSCFTLRLPALPQEFLPSECADAAVHAENCSVDDPQPTDVPAVDTSKRVLVVEDGPDAADLLCELLESEGYIVELARDGVSAVQRAASRLPDVCVLDIGLPGMDGYEVAQRIRKLDEHCSTKIIAVTGWGSSVDRSRSQEAGFDVHMVKPIIYSELLAEINGTHTGQDSESQHSTTQASALA